MGSSCRSLWRRWRSIGRLVQLRGRRECVDRTAPGSASLIGPAVQRTSPGQGLLVGQRVDVVSTPALLAAVDLKRAERGS
jgi:hypothetical protein